MKETAGEYGWIVVYDYEDRDRIGTIMRVTEVFDDGSVRGYFQDSGRATVREYGTLTPGTRQTNMVPGDAVTAIIIRHVGWTDPHGIQGKFFRRLGDAIEMQLEDGTIHVPDTWTVDDIVSCPKVEQGDRVQALKVNGVSKAEGKEGVVTLTGSSLIWVRFDELIQDDECGFERDTWVVHSWARVAEKKVPADAVERSQAAEIQRLRDELSMAQMKLANHEENFDQFKRQVVTAAKIAARKEGWCADGTNRVLAPLGLSLDDPAEPRRFRFRVWLTMDIQASCLADREPDDVDDDFIQGSITNTPFDGSGCDLEMDGDWEDVVVVDTDWRVEDVEAVED